MLEENAIAMNIATEALAVSATLFAIGQMPVVISGRSKLEDAMLGFERAMSSTVKTKMNRAGR